MKHNAPDVLRSSTRLHYDITAATAKSCKAAAREVQLGIRDKLPGYRTAAGKFEGYAATGALRRAVSVTDPRKTAAGYHAEVFLAPGRHMEYARIHEFGGIIRAKNPTGYLRFQVRGRWVRVRQVRIRQKKYWRGATTSTTDARIASRINHTFMAVK